MGVAGLAILIIGAMVLNEMRAGFVVSKKQDLVAQAQIFTSLLGEDATTPQPALDVDAPRQTIVRLNLPERVRARIYTPDGALGAAFWIPALFVPPLLVSHGYIFWRLLREIRSAGVAEGEPRHIGL